MLAMQGVPSDAAHFHILPQVGEQRLFTQGFVFLYFNAAFAEHEGRQRQGNPPRTGPKQICLQAMENSALDANFGPKPAA